MLKKRITFDELRMRLSAGRTIEEVEKAMLAYDVCRCDDLASRNKELESELESVKKTCRAASKCHDMEQAHNTELAEEIERLREELNEWKRICKRWLRCMATTKAKETDQ